MLHKGEGQLLTWVLAYPQPAWVRGQLEGNRVTFVSYVLPWLALASVFFLVSEHGSAYRIKLLFIGYSCIINLIPYLFQFIYSLVKDCIHFKKGGWRTQRGETKKLRELKVKHEWRKAPMAPGMLAWNRDFKSGYFIQHKNTQSRKNRQASLMYRLVTDSPCCLDSRHVQTRVHSLQGGYSKHRRGGLHDGRRRDAGRPFQRGECHGLCGFWVTRVSQNLLLALLVGHTKAFLAAAAVYTLCSNYNNSLDNWNRAAKASAILPV